MHDTHVGSHIDTLVIGAGLSGLTAAYTLQQAGRSVKLVEASMRAGGLIHTNIEHGFAIEGGPNTFPSTATELLALCRDLRLEPKPATPKADKRYLYVHKKLTALPGKPQEALTTSVLSPLGKLRALCEPLIPKTRTQDMSVARFFERRVGREVLENLVDPFISGIYAGNVKTLSLPAVFPKLWQWEQTHGSLMRGAQAQGKAAKASGKPKKRMQLLSFTGGLQRLTDTLAEALHPGTLMLGQSVTHIEAHPGWYAVTTHAGERFECRHLILSTPAYTSAKLLHPFLPEASDALESIPYNGLVVAHLGFNEADIPHPLDGFGCLIPRREKIPLLGTIWASSLFPDRAPKGQVLLSNFIGGAHHPEIASWSPAQVEQQVLTDLQTVFHAKKPLKPTYSHIVEYEKAIPQYSMGHRETIARLEQSLATQPGVFVCGNYLHGVALNECVKSGMQAAKQIVETATTHHELPHSGHSPNVS